jgi:prophage antirepressor-like protein
MNQITPFQFEGTNVRIVMSADGEPLFVGKDVCDALGYARASDAMQQHCKGAAIYRPLQTAGGIQETRVIAEPDMMRLVSHCALPAGIAFEKLIYEDILPTIRKTGRYGPTPAQTPEPQPTEAPRIVTPMAELDLAVSLIRSSERDLGLPKKAVHQMYQALWAKAGLPGVIPMPEEVKASPHKGMEEDRSDCVPTVSDETNRLYFKASDGWRKRTLPLTRLLETHGVPRDVKEMNRILCYRGIQKRVVTPKGSYLEILETQFGKNLCFKQP